MKAILLTIAAAATAASLMAVAPAAAQDLRIGAGNGGVSVRVGEDRPREGVTVIRRDNDRRHWRERRDRDRRVMVIDRRDRADCSTTIRTRRPDGSVVIRKRSGC